MPWYMYAAFLFLGVIAYFVINQAEAQGKEGCRPQGRKGSGEEVEVGKEKAKVEKINKKIFQKSLTRG